MVRYMKKSIKSLSNKKNIYLMIGLSVICLIIIIIMVFLMLPLNSHRNNDSNKSNNTTPVSSQTPTPSVTPTPTPTPSPSVTPSPSSTPSPSPSPTPSSKPKPTSSPKPMPSVSKTEITRIFEEKKAVVAGDSMAEGLVAYGVLPDSNVVWYRGRRIDNMKTDMPKITSLQPKYLFLTYGSNDLELWVGRVDPFINHFKNTLSYIRSVLPDTQIIINSILPVSDEAIKRNNAFSYQELFNTRLKQLADSEGIPFLENSVYLEYNANPFSTDGVHPKGFYYPLWAKNMANYLENH